MSKLAIKVMMIGVVTILLTIAVSVLSGTLSSRKGLQAGTVDEVGALWGQPQRIAGPYFRVPITEKQGFSNPSKRELLILPEELDLKLALENQERHRSIYTAQVYSGTLTAEGKFVGFDSTIVDPAINDIHWDQATLEFNISDTRGIETPLFVTFGGKQFELMPATVSPISSPGGEWLQDRRQRVIGAKVSLADSSGQSLAQNFDLNLTFRGSEEIQVVPLGKTTTVHMVSDWPHPSFDGSIIPTMQTTTDDGFEASWSSGHFTRGYGQSIINHGSVAAAVNGSSFGVSFVDPIDIYHRLERSTKYVLLILVLVFGLFFTLEMKSKNRIHPMQYLFVGMAIVVFYMMLIASTEMFTFDVGYVASAVSACLLITAYMKFVLGAWTRALGVGATLAGMFGFIYVLLSAQTYSLILGSIGLFIALAVLMYTTRKVDWYNEE